MASCQSLDSIVHLAGAISTREFGLGCRKSRQHGPNFNRVSCSGRQTSISPTRGSTAPNAHASHLVSVTASITSCGRMVIEAQNCH